MPILSTIDSLCISLSAHLQVGTVSTSTALGVEHLGTAQTVHALARVALQTKAAYLEGTSLNCLKTSPTATGDNAGILWC